MIRLGYVFGISLQTELLILSFFGIVYTILDASLLEFNSNLNKVWNLRMDPARFSEGTEESMKYIMVTIIMVRTFTIHLYLGSYIMMLYPLIFEDRPGLILPWMVLNVVKCLLTNIISFLTGVFICMKYRWMKPSCWEFLLSTITHYIPPLYMFYLVFTFYRELKRFVLIQKYIDPYELKAHRRALMLSERNAREAQTCERQEQEPVPTTTTTIPLQTTTNTPHILDPNEPTTSTVPTVSIIPTVPTVPTIPVLSRRTPSPAWYHTTITTTSTKDAAVSGRTFKVNNGVLEVVPDRDREYSDLGSEEYDEYEEVQKISDLDSHETRFRAPPSNMHHTQTQVTPTKEATTEPIKNNMINSDYKTVSDLLNDPNIALVLNMITGKDDPFQEDLSKLENYEITITEEAPWWPSVEKTKATPASPKPKSKKPPPKPWTRPEKKEIAVQVSSPYFDQIMSTIQYPFENENFIKIGQEEPHETSKDSAPLSPEKKETPGTQRRRSGSPNPSKRRIQPAYPRTYKDDGYTQAFYENLAKKKEKEAKK